MKISTLLTLLSILFLSCSEDNTIIEPSPTAYRITQTVSYDSISVDVVIFEFVELSELVKLICVGRDCVVPL